MIKCKCGHAHADPNVKSGRNRRIIRRGDLTLVLSEICTECTLPPCIHFVPENLHEA